MSWQTFPLGLVFPQLAEFPQLTNQLHAAVCLGDLASDLGQRGISRRLHLRLLTFTQWRHHSFRILTNIVIINNSTWSAQTGAYRNEVWIWSVDPGHGSRSGDFQIIQSVQRYMYHKIVIIQYCTEKTWHTAAKVDKNATRVRFLETPRNAIYFNSVRLMWWQSTQYVNTVSFNVSLHQCFVQYTVQVEATSNRYYSCSLMLSCHSAWQTNWSGCLIVWMC